MTSRREKKRKKQSEVYGELCCINSNLQTTNYIVSSMKTITGCLHLVPISLALMFCFLCILKTLIIDLKLNYSVSNIMLISLTYWIDI